MSEQRHPEQERLWAILRQAEPPPGARERVGQRIEESLDRELLHRPRRKRNAIALGVAAATAALVLLAVARDRTPSTAATGGDAEPARGIESPEPPPGGSTRAALSDPARPAPADPARAAPSDPARPAPADPARAAPSDPARAAPGRVIGAHATTQGERELASGDAVELGRVRVAAEGRLRMTLGDTEVDVNGPATFDVRPRDLFVREGRVEIRGTSWVAGPGCLAEIAGRAEVEVSRDQVQITLFAGSATAANHASCQLIDLTQDARDPGGNRGPSGNRSPVPGSPPTAASPPASPPAVAAGGGAGGHLSATSDPVRDRDMADRVDQAGQTSSSMGPARASSALARQVDAFSAAESMRKSDPAAALARFEAMRNEWPRSALRHEIDLAIIDLLVRLGRLETARTEARRFLQQHPNSPRGAHVSRIATEE